MTAARGWPRAAFMLAFVAVVACKWHGRPGDESHNPPAGAPSDGPLPTGSPATPAQADTALLFATPGCAVSTATSTGEHLIFERNSSACVLEVAGEVICGPNVLRVAGVPGLGAIFEPDGENDIGEFMAGSAPAPGWKLDDAGIQGEGGACPAAAEGTAMDRFTAAPAGPGIWQTLGIDPASTLSFSAEVRAVTGTTWQSVMVACGDPAAGVPLASCWCRRSDLGGCEVTAAGSQCTAYASVGTAPLRLEASTTCSAPVATMGFGYAPGRLGAFAADGCAAHPVRAAAAHTWSYVPGGASRAHDGATLPTPAGLGGSYCLYATAAPLQPWNAASVPTGLLSIGDPGSANSTSLSISPSPEALATVCDSAAQCTQLAYPLPMPEEHAIHDLALCNDGGALRFMVDGELRATDQRAIAAQPPLVHMGELEQGAAGARLLGVWISRDPVFHRRDLRSRAVAVVGASNAAGYNTYAPASLHLARQDAGLRMHNVAVSGFTTAQCLQLWRDQVRGKGYEVVIVLCGSNDLIQGASADSTWANLKTIVDEALSDRAAVVALTLPPWRGDLRWTPDKQSETLRCNALIKSYAPPSSYRALDLYADLDDGTGQMLSPYRQADMLHLNDSGQAHVAALLLDVLR